jgi:pimeloyl-ACP methyl ester carboxylesterase
MTSRTLVQHVWRSTLHSLLPAAAAAASAMSILSTAGVSAQSSAAHSGGQQPTIVLVHGAWADASSWDGVIKRLQDDGYPVIALANPLRSVASDSAYIASVLDTIPGPVVLVGHSYGGMVITNAAALTTNRSIQALVYVAAFIPEVGESPAQLIGHTAPGQPGSSHIVPPGTPGVPANLTARPFPPLGPTDLDFYINADAYSDVFAADVPPATERLMAVTQRPFTLRAFTETSAAATWKTIPSWSLVATSDNALGTANALFMAQRTITEGKGHLTEVNASHAVLVSHPDVVEDLINSATRSLVGAAR